MVINQGDVFWAYLNPPAGSEPGYKRPVVVVQNNLFNHSRIHTIVCCAITSNLQRAASPGNVALARGEANLPKRCVVNITCLVTLDRMKFIEKLGTLPRRRINEIIRGLMLLLLSNEASLHSQELCDPKGNVPLPG